MIREVILTTVSVAGTPHIAPMGVHVAADRVDILPFKPSTTLDNLLATGCAVINYVDDVRLFAGCVTDRRDWPLTAASVVQAPRLHGALAHAEVEWCHTEDDPLRPRLVCRIVHQGQHLPFTGFNRAQHSVLEAAILVSRLDRLPREKVETELAYLAIGLEKTGGPREREAWNWLLHAITHHYATRSAP
ncbi:MAG: DUF447 domain-containing protein [Methylococcaceae bacterium]